MSAFKNLITRIYYDKSVRLALYVFALTRLVVLATFVLGSQLSALETKPFGEHQDAAIPLDLRQAKQKLKAMATRGDAGWYLTIAQSGYERVPFEVTKQRNWAFFPLHPLLWSIAASLTGEFEFTGIALANLFFLLALIFLHKLALLYGYNGDDAHRIVFYAAIFPTSYFFSTPMTESLFLLLTVSSFWAAKKEHWWLAGVLGGLASGTRIVGVILLPTLLLLAWQKYGKSWNDYAKTIGLILIPSGLLVFMYHLYIITGNAFAFKDINVTWGRRPTLFWQPLLNYIIEPNYIASPWNFDLLNFIVTIIGFTCAVVFLKKREFAFAFFITACIVISLTSGTLHSQARYVSVIFPIFFVFAIAGRSPRVNQLIQIVSVSLLSLMSFLYAARFTLAMT